MAVNKEIAVHPIRFANDGRWPATEIHFLSLDNIGIGLNFFIDAR